jgi:hypothetical protein
VSEVSSRRVMIWFEVLMVLVVLVSSRLISVLCHIHAPGSIVKKVLFDPAFLIFDTRIPPLLYLPICSKGFLRIFVRIASEKVRRPCQQLKSKDVARLR